jgi:hypothetical protein
VRLQRTVCQMPTAETATLRLFELTLRWIDAAKRHPQLSWVTWVLACLLLAAWALLGEAARPISDE